MKNLSGAKLTKKLDKTLRELYHKKYPHPTCFVCGNQHGWYGPENRRGCQIGHYVSRRYSVLRWDEKNIYPHCAGCNKLHNINPVPFTQAILKLYGKQRLDYLEERYRSGTPPSTSEKRALLAELEHTLQSLS